jgi:hypothetical protein
MWPAFAAAVLVEGVTFDRLPFSGAGPDGLVPALLLAMALNLVVVAVLAPAAGLLLRRRRRDLPRAIATDLCGTALVGALLAGTLVAGIAHHGALARDGRDHAAALAAMSTFVHHQAPAYLPRLAGMDAVEVEDGMWRVCVSGSEPLCVFADTKTTPPGVTRDGDRIPNAQWAR